MTREIWRAQECAGIYRFRMSEALNFCKFLYICARVVITQVYGNLPVLYTSRAVEVINKEATNSKQLCVSLGQNNHVYRFMAYQVLSQRGRTHT